MTARVGTGELLTFFTDERFPWLDVYAVPAIAILLRGVESVLRNVICLRYEP